MIFGRKSEQFEFHPQREFRYNYLILREIY